MFIAVLASLRRATSVWVPFAAALFTGLGLTDIAHGQTPESVRAGDADSAALSDIVVTARRRDESLQTEPLSIQALTGDQLQQMHIQQLSDLNNVANVSFNYQPAFMNTLTPFIRGIGEQDPVLTNDQPVAVYVDGVLLARAIGVNFDLIEPQSVEVLRGPQGSLFGRNTTGGAVSIHLPSPSDEFNVTAKAGFASNQEWTGGLILNTGEIGNTGLKATVAYQYHNMNGFVRNALTDDEKHWPGSDESSSLYFALHGKLGAVAAFDLRADYMSTIDDENSGQVVTPSPAVASYFGNSPTYGGDPYIYSQDVQRLGTLEVYKSMPLSWGKFGGTSLTIDLPLNPAVDVKSITAFRKFVTDVSPVSTQGLLLGPVLNPVTFAYDGIQRVTPYTLESGLLGREDADVSRQEQYSEELQVSGDLGSMNKYVAGLYAFDEQVGESYLAYLTVLLPTIPGIGYPSYGGINYWGHSESFAGYLSDTFTPPVLDNRLEFTGGVRYTKDIKSLDYLTLAQLPDLPTAHHSATFSDPSGDFTTKMQWTADFMTYVRFANAYKSGGFSGRDAYNAPGYKPETANNWEVGLKSDWLDHRLRINGDLFYTIYDNKQVTTYAPGLGSNGINESHVVNAGKAVYPGGELEMTLLPVRFWQIDVDYGHVNPKYKVFLYQPSASAPAQNIASSAKFPYFSNTSYSIGNTLRLDPLPFGDLSLHVDFDYKSQMVFGVTTLFNPLNDVIKARSQNLLNASIDLSSIAVGGAVKDLKVSLYGKNLMNRAYIVNGVDWEIVPGYDNWGTVTFARLRVLGVQLTGKF